MWCAVAALALCSVFAVLMGVGQAVIARHRAGGAADLVALAVADRAWTQGADACVWGARVGAAQGAEVVRCDVVGEVADVSVRGRSGAFSALVRSRAGPAPEGAGPAPGQEAAP
ncbi:Rv3654c family TadE-like protein [Streptomyces sp. NPDC060194]|uniref:Rv3654c family TadE-like protein n=1 Tax=Streptomyces sp. NPDC060194 TaxID=3347069 RepID=UPI003664E4DF